MSSDSSDLNPLTPAHFLIGESLTSLPEEDYSCIPENRSKWKKNSSVLLTPDVVVLTKKDGLPPLKWLLGRMISVQPGSDGIVRAATVRTATSTIQRPARKLCILPLDIET
ncbi:hypothetical protein HUJ05_007742 [Dendroctonus ponderosae]|nr:hypothetical protein HUJ05_007742 [Dendroctonus ponderosae]